MFFLSLWNFDSYILFIYLFLIFDRTVKSMSANAVLRWGPRMILKMGRRNNNMSKQRSFVTKSERKRIL